MLRFNHTPHDGCTCHIDETRKVDSMKLTKQPLSKDDLIVITAFVVGFAILALNIFGALK